MSLPPSPPPPFAGTQTVSARLKMSVGDLAINAIIAVPAAPSPAEAVLPTLQNLINTVVEAAEAREAREGREISCRKGCGACCRQLVPISFTERRTIRALIAAQPAERRESLQRRFQEAANKLADAGLSQVLLDPAERKGRSDRELSLAYFALGIACPFLEEESCSIHPDRPLVCREYLVTSPAANCANKDQAGVETVGVPKLSVAARSLEQRQPTPDMVKQWIPLALALEPDPRPAGQSPELLAGPDWIKRFFAGMQAGGGDV